ncbi:hypothetical protein STEG23_017979, partial [Scotinomys teguina]
LAHSLLLKAPRHQQLTSPNEAASFRTGLAPATQDFWEERGTLDESRDQTDASETEEVGHKLYAAASNHLDCPPPLLLMATSSFILEATRVRRSSRLMMPDVPRDSSGVETRPGVVPEGLHTGEEAGKVGKARSPTPSQTAGWRPEKLLLGRIKKHTVDDWGDSSISNVLVHKFKDPSLDPHEKKPGVVAHAYKPKCQ